MRTGVFDGGDCALHNATLLPMCAKEEPMTMQSTTTSTDLANRSNAGPEVTLLWSRSHGTDETFARATLDGQGSGVAGVTPSEQSPHRKE